jgi:hypothetical protein
MTSPTRTSADRLALMGCLTAVFGELHPYFDQWAQRSEDAALKGLHGDHRVYADGTPAGEETGGRSGRPACTASQAGRRAAARHVASYTAGQLAGTMVVTRVLGYRVPPRALLAGTVINAVTHAVIDRRDPLLRLASRLGLAGYVEHCAAVRMAPDGTLTVEASGPGTALTELDQALHRGIGVAAALLTTWLATRSPAGRS